MNKFFLALFLSLPLVMIFFQVPDYLRGGPPIGNDSSSHIVAIAQVAEYVQEGELHFWNPAFNLGYPLLHFYQPLSYLLSALTALLLGGPEKAIVAYKLWMIINLCLIPLSYFIALRRLDFDEITALCGGLLALTLTSMSDFGISTAAFFRLGLYSALFGAVWLPLAFAECLRYINGNGKLSYATISLLGVYFSHSFLGTGLVPIIILASLIYGKLKGIFGRVWRLVILGTASFLCSAFWTIPMLLTWKYMGGWPWESDQHLHGYQWQKLLATFCSGKLTDNERFPVILILAICGLAIAHWQAVKRPAPRLILVGFYLSLLFLAGRTTFGHAIDWIFPPNATLPLERYLCLLEFFVILLAATGAGAIIGTARASMGFPLIGSGLIAFTLCFPALLNWHDELASGLTTRAKKSSSVDFDTLIVALAGQDDSGRYFTSRRLGFGSHWDMYLPAFYTHLPGGVSYGSGSHDSMNFYFLDQLRFQSSAVLPKEMELYNIRYLITDKKRKFNTPALTMIGAYGDYRLHQLKGTYGYFAVIAEPRILAETSPRLSRSLMLNWIYNDYLQGKPFLRLPDPLTVAFTMNKNDSPLGVTTPPSFHFHPSASGNVGIAAGKVLAEQIGKWWYSCDVSAEGERNWLLLKVTAHPFWRAEIAGKPVDIYYLSPAFMGIPLPSGVHQVRFSYEHPRWQFYLLIIGGLTLILVLGVDLPGIVRKREPETTLNADDPATQDVNEPTNGNLNLPVSH